MIDIDIGREDPPRPSMSVPEDMAVKADRMSASIASTVESCGARMSSVNFAEPTTLFMLLGWASMTPVEASPPWRTADWLLYRIIFEAARSASLREWRGVVPVWLEAPVRFMVNQRYAWAPVTIPIDWAFDSRMGPCSMWSSKWAAMGLEVNEQGTLPW